MIGLITVSLGKDEDGRPGRHELENLRWGIWGCVSEVGEPWSARPRRFEMEGSEHLVSSNGGEGGGTYP